MESIYTVTILLYVRTFVLITLLAITSTGLAGKAYFKL